MAESNRVLEQRHTWDHSRRTYVLSGDPAQIDKAKPETRTASTSAPVRRFLRGPVPWDWLVRAAQLPGKALVVGLCLWRLSGAKGKDTVMLANAELKPFGVDRAAKSRALAALEKAGLIAVQHHPGRFPVVTLLVGK